MHSTVSVFSLSGDFLLFFFLTTCLTSPFLQLILRIQYIIHKTEKICVNRLFTLSAKLPVDSRLLVVKLQGSKKLYTEFSLHGGAEVLAPLTLTLFKDQLYIHLQLPKLKTY